MKKIFLLSICILFSVCGFASVNVFPLTNTVSSNLCIPNPKVTSDTISNFCTLFPKSVASCSPIKPGSAGPTKKYMDLLYSLMIARFGTLEQACAASAAAADSTPAACVSQWQCYRNGGISSDPKDPGKCSGTGLAC